ncbi:MAG TPA: metallophosphoesterase [Prolixibacteraceae bacterium]
MKTNIICMVMFMSFFLLLNNSCKKDTYDNSISKSVYTIAVISDIHYMDPSLLPDTGSLAFKEYLKTDGKLLAESDAIMKEVIWELLHATPKPDLVLIPGDLTKDGELVSHQSVSKYLSQLINAGIKVRVIDGNHDINNPHPYMYIGSTTQKVANIDAGGFKTIYENCGYSDALYTDPSSLSYVSEPLPGLWLIAIDACKYWDGIPFSLMTGGRIKQETMTWILARIAEAEAKGKTVFGMMHHGILNHFTNEESMFKGFVVDRSSTVSDSLMNAGLRIMFTGHFHANDIVKKTSGNTFLFDIETGSPVVYPCPYRMITYLKDSALIISSDTITHNDYPLPGGQTFSFYAKQKAKVNLDSLLTISFTSSNCTYETARIFAPRIRNAMMAHFAGDERLYSTHETDSIDITITRLGSNLSWLRPFCISIWTDLPPTDNSLMIYLKSGASFKLVR